MILKDYLSISGQHGLFRFLTQGRNAIIVEHLETKKRTSAFGTAKVNSLEDITIFTRNEDVKLSEVFDRIYEKQNGGPCPDDKSDMSILRSFFEQILPEYDRNRVYDSDIRKIFRWYNILQKLNLLVKEEKEKEKEEEKVKETGEKKVDELIPTEKKSPVKKLKTAAKSKVKKETNDQKTKAKGSSKSKSEKNQ